MVGGSAWAASLNNGATISGGRAVLATSGPYLKLPAGVLGVASSVTIEGWVYVNSSSTGRARIFDLGTSSCNNNILLYRTNVSGHLYLSKCTSGTSVDADSSLDFSSLGYFYFAVVLSTGRSALYINGNLSTSTSSALTIPTASQQVHEHACKKLNMLRGYFRIF